MIKKIINSPKYGPHTLLIDEQDLDLLEQNKYSVKYNTTGNYKGKKPRFEGFGRTFRTNTGFAVIILHREILSRILQRPLQPHEYTDHIDRNPNNNTRANLRLANASTNAQNRSRQNNNTSGYTGVTWDKAKRKWKVQIGRNKNKHVGYFKCKHEAARVYNAKAKELWGEFANLNVILEDD